ncbi:hypothetical protein D3C87_1612480 [compost metagenome]
MPMRASTTTAMGTSNERPNARNIDNTKLRYASMSGAAVMLLGAKLWMNANTWPNTR